MTKEWEILACLRDLAELVDDRGHSWYGEREQKLLCLILAIVESLCTGTLRWDDDEKCLRKTATGDPYRVQH